MVVLVAENKPNESVIEINLVNRPVIFLDTKLSILIAVNLILILFAIACALRIWIAILNIKKYRAKQSIRSRPPILEDDEYYDKTLEENSPKGKKIVKAEDESPVGKKMAKDSTDSPKGKNTTKTDVESPKKRKVVKDSGFYG